MNNNNVTLVDLETGDTDMVSGENYRDIYSNEFRWVLITSFRFHCWW